MLMPPPISERAILPRLHFDHPAAQASRVQRRPSLLGNVDRVSHVVRMAVGDQDVVHPAELGDGVFVRVAGNGQPRVDQNHTTRGCLYPESGLPVPVDLGSRLCDVAVAASIASASNTVRNLFICSMGFPPSVWTFLIRQCFLMK
jgi:hypothetical protein